MRLSLSWLIILLLVVYIGFFASYGWKVYESFRDTTIEGFQITTDISLSSCPPSEMDESILMKGSVPAGSTQTFCYDGSIQKCSLSVPSTSPDSCTQYYLALLQSKANSRCPASMPNYFQSISYAQNVDNSVRGCSSGARTADGKSPASSTDSHCKIYTREKDDMEKLDSCTNVKRLESAKCFSRSIPGVTTALKENKYGSPLVQCTFSQMESVKSGTKTIDTNAAAGEAQNAAFAQEARDVVKRMASQGPVRVQPPLNGPCTTVFLSIGRVGNYINISQIVIRNEQGINVAKTGTISGTTAFGAYTATAVDGNERPRPYPQVYHSDNTGSDYFRIDFATPIRISSISIFNRSDCCQDRLAISSIYVVQSGQWLNYGLTSDLVQTLSFIPPPIQANYVTEDIFSPESVTYTCTELDSYRSWINSIKTLYPDMYEKSKRNLDTSETWSKDKKNTFCTILERTKIEKTMTDTDLEKVSVL